jgi:hypothetical protein
MSKNLKSLGIILLTVLITTGFSGCMKSKYVKYDDIDDIEYAEPTEYAKNFDIEAYVDELPEAEYEKIDYKVKETYIYKFNDYEMTIDIPEGFEAYEVPMLSRSKIVDSTGIEDSYSPATVQFGKHAYGPATDTWRPMWNEVISDDWLCVERYNESSEVITGGGNRYKCVGGIACTPHKSAFKGVSLRDSYIRTFVTCSESKSYRKISEKNIIITSSDWWNLESEMIVSDQQSLSCRYIHDNSIDGDNFDKNLLYNILNSFKISSIK